MPEKEFDLYLSLLSRLLRLSPEQKSAIDNELRDHLEARFEELVRRGMPREEAIQWALDEFGDAARLAQEFTKLSRRNVRRWIMRCTLATAAMGAVVLLVVNAFLPEQRGVPVVQNVVAQEKNSAAAAPAVDAAPADEERDVVWIDPAEFLSPPLSQPIHLELKDTPLNEAVKLISQQIDAPIFIDHRNFVDAGLTPDVSVTESSAGEPLFVVLNRMLRSVGDISLGWYWEDEILHITTHEAAQEKLQTVSYNVRDLLEAGCTFDSVTESLQNYTEGPWQALDGIGGTLRPFGDRLIIRHTAQVHAEVAAMLASLRREGRERHVMRPASDATLRQQLSKVVSVNLEDVPLSEALDSINRQYGTSLRIDVNAFEDAGVQRDAPVSLILPNRPLRTVLKYLLQDIDGVECSPVVQDGGIWITTAEVAFENHQEIVLYDISDLVSDDAEVISELLDVIQEETSGPWQNLDGIGGSFTRPLDGLLIIRHTEQVQHEIASLLADHRASLAQAKAEGKTPDLAAQARHAPITQHYQLDTETAEDVLTLIPEFVASGTWSSTVDRDGNPVKLSDTGIGSIRKVAAGRKILQHGSQAEEQSQVADSNQSGNVENKPAGVNEHAASTDVLVIPQSVLIITHKRSVHQQIREFLKKLEQGSTEDSGAGAGSGGGGFFSVVPSASSLSSSRRRHNLPDR
jgi:hypothetical protein